MNWHDLVNCSLTREDKIHKHCSEERGELFYSFHPGSVELEVMDFLYGLVRLFKPLHLLETGTHRGISTVAIAMGIKANGVGRLTTIERDINFCNMTQNLLENLQLTPVVNIENVHSIEFCSNYSKDPFDFAFFDSHPSTRTREFNILHDRNKLSNLAIFHDTSPLREKTYKVASDNHPQFLKDLALIEEKTRGCIECPYGRGLRCFQIQQS